MSTKTITKLEATRQQLERAIDLYLSGLDYISAITLAGAAEEPLGKMRRRDVPSLSVVEALAEDFRYQESFPPISRKEMIAKLNIVRDWLKHYTDGSSLEFDEKESAFNMILRAIINYMIAANGPTESMKVFLHMHPVHPDTDACPETESF